MLSYQHGYHAGNFADVLKHMVSVQILNYLKQKEKPFFYLDTHAGCGGYNLHSEQATKTFEYVDGIGKLFDLPSSEMPTALADYLAMVKNFNQKNQCDNLTYYPGSPWFAIDMLREQDRAALYDLHPNEFQLLMQTLREHRNECRHIKLFNQDGFQACMSQLPPKERRSLILMDPPYEVKTDYKKAVDTLIKAHKKFATGTYALWYPVVERYRIDEIEQAFKNSGIANIQLFEFGIDRDSEQGMKSAGMIVINPPWTLMPQMQETLPLLKTHLSPKKGFYRYEQLTKE